MRCNEIKKKISNELEIKEDRKNNLSKIEKKVK